MVRKVKVQIEGKSYGVIFDELKHKSEEKGSSSVSIIELCDSKVIIAQMPGTVLAINVTEGESVEVNDSLLVYESMKLESVIYSPAATTIKKVLVSEGDTVSTDQILFELV